ncbi:MAG: hypothetical protein RI556_11475 [Hydrogenovibrio sp.]|uniref:hypothetical protein n=1 Tax=Hydrogenovibrio sp. TaxID=2065821 RepID=UPI002870B179|nr:hypothetical protein [Hydrogenovibrio sp.]MDR9499787.1 hypothetical protein [Hydrogenovibrio sp.]
MLLSNRLDNRWPHYSKNVCQNLSALFVLIGVGVILWSLSSSAKAQTAQTLDAWQLQQAQNLEAIGQQAAQNGHPVMLLFTRLHGGGSDTLKEEAILPVVENGLLEGYAVMLEVTLNTGGEVIDFYGEPVSKQTLADWYNISKYPTLITLDPSGEEVSERMETAGAYEYVPHRIKKMVNQGLQAMGQSKRLDF